MLKTKVLQPGSVTLDTVVLGLLLVALNLLIARDDPGWFGLNPTPYVLLPLLLGARYGFNAGFFAGIATAAGIVLAQTAFTQSSLQQVTSQSLYLAASLVLCGSLTGELFAWLHRDLHQSDAKLVQLQESAARLDHEVRFLRNLKDDYDRMLAASGGEFSTLETDLRRLQTTAAADLPETMLHLLKRLVRLTDAAVYAIEPDGAPLKRLALLGDDTHLPAQLSADKSPIVTKALAQNAMVLLPALLKEQSAIPNEPALIAAPLKNADGKPSCLLLVSGIPFVSFTPRLADIVLLICAWTGELLDLAAGAEGRYRVVRGLKNIRLYTAEHFAYLVKLTFDGYNRHRLSSTVVVLSLPAGDTATKERFETVILANVRESDFAAETAG
ncbi:MAG: hypothetical protein KDK74_13720, partial [Cephaloticoccus sp.]|nr:hypothetical protein [Cephaloticoccus sp.]